MNEQAMV